MRNKRTHASEANARLAAAAPEMLNYLEDAAYQLERLTGESLVAYSRTFAVLVKKIISKAKGEA